MSEVAKIDLEGCFNNPQIYNETITTIINSLKCDNEIAERMLNSALNASGFNPNERIRDK